MTGEKENTFRGLKGELLVVTSWKCRINWHQWTRWEILPSSGTLAEPKKLSGKGYAMFEMHRHCVHCGTLQLAHTTSERHSLPLQ